MIAICLLETLGNISRHSITARFYGDNPKFMAYAIFKTNPLLSSIPRGRFYFLSYLLLYSTSVEDL